MNAKIFIDAENVNPEVCFKAVEIFSNVYSVDRVDIIGNETKISNKYLTAGKIYRVQNSFHGKNSADTWLCMEIARTILEEPDTEFIVIVSSDRDFLPAVKFAVEHGKKVFIVSEGVGHKNLAALFEEVGINSKFVQLINFNDWNIETTNNTEKKGVKKIMSNESKNLSESNTKKIRQLYPRFSENIRKFLQKREAQIKFIPIKHGNIQKEIPFIDGIDLGSFTPILRELNIIGKNESPNSLIEENSFKLVGKKIHFVPKQKVETLPDDKFKKISGLTIQSRIYFNKNNAKIIFVKCGKNLLEMPFVEGMHLQTFLRVLIEMNAVDKNSDVKKIIDDSFLKLENNCVYFRNEDELAEEENFADEEENIDAGLIIEYLLKNIGDVKKIFVKTDYDLREIFFVDGMPLEFFAGILLEGKIIDDVISIPKIIEESLLKMHDKKVYLRRDEDFDEENFTEEEAVTELDFENLSDESREFLHANENKIHFVQIVHNKIIYDVPFVDGMQVQTFVKILRELKIFAKNTKVAKVLNANGFDVENNLVRKL